MKKCINCGNEISDESKFCSHCGSKVEIEKNFNTGEGNVKNEKMVQKKPVYKNVWFWILVSILGIMFIGTDNETNNSSSNSSYQMSISSSVDNTHYIGDEVACSNWKIQVSGVETANMVSDNNETTWFYITFYATNIGNKEDTFKPSYISISKGEVVYRNIELLGNKYFERSRACQPFVKEKFTMVFEVPRGSDYQDFIFNVKFIINSTSISLRNRI